MSSERPPGGESPPTIIERQTVSDPASAPTIIENRSAPAVSTPFLNLVPGSDFREYRLVRPLKVASAEADLWLIARRADGREFVLKLYRYGLHPKPEILDALRRLRHEHVVEIVASGEQDGRSFEIQEFVSNGSLADVIKRGAVPEAEAREILSELADSLAHLHEARVLHRDIKPANILVRSLAPPDLILTDFGISSLSDNVLHLTNVNRTAAYCAPEALTGVVARASDWWSVGAIVIELLTGRHPLAGMSEQVVNFQLVSKGIPIPPEIPESWRPLLQGLLTRDHEKRWGADQVRAWLAGRKDIPLHWDGAAASATPGRKPYKFDNRDFLEPRELAAAFAQKWADAVKHCSWGLLNQWVDKDLGDNPLAGVMREASVDRQLNPDQRAAVVILLLNPELPLIYKGALVDLDWCRQNAADAVALAKSGVPKWLTRLRKESCLEAWVKQWEARKQEINAFGIPLDQAIVDRLLSAPDPSVISAAHEQRAQFAATREPKLQGLLSKPELTLAEAVVLLASDRKLWLTGTQKSHWEQIDKLKAFGVAMDWPLVERLVASENWELVRPMWEQCAALWPRRRSSGVPLSSPRLEHILGQASPQYLDAVAVVANRLDYVNSLGMRFVAVPGLSVLFSVWTARVRDYQAFVQASGRAWKAPFFKQTPEHPAVNVSWDEANAFCEWLTEKERREQLIGPADEYRLPYDIEWSHAVGLENEVDGLPIEKSGKIKGVFPWGTQWPPPPNVANIASAVRVDAFTQTSPVGSFAPNAFGIHDLGSNVTEWCWDWYDPGHQMKTLRGASWFQSTPESLWSSVRRFFVPNAKSDSVGFRCVLVLRTFMRPSAGEVLSAPG